MHPPSAAEKLSVFLRYQWYVFDFSSDSFVVQRLKHRLHHSMEVSEPHIPLVKDVEQLAIVMAHNVLESTKQQ